MEKTSGMPVAVVFSFSKKYCTGIKQINRKYETLKDLPSQSQVQFS